MGSASSQIFPGSLKAPSPDNTYMFIGLFKQAFLQFKYKVVAVSREELYLFFTALLNLTNRTAHCSHYTMDEVRIPKVIYLINAILAVSSWSCVLNVYCR